MVPAHPHAWLGLALTLGGDLAAVLLLTGYVHLVWSRRSTPLTAAAAAETFDREHGAGEAREVLVLAGGRTALVRTRDGELGVVGARGRGWSTRVLHAGDVRRAVRRGEAVRLALRDYAHPSLTLRFPSAQAEADWLPPFAEPAP